jgi:phage baseplate assembly protein V
MIGWLRWGRARGTAEGKIQSARVEVFENLGRDEAMRPQDYGFTSLPVDGQALVIEAGGHTIVLRQDVLASRPAMAAYDVAVWHKDGHMVSLKSGRVVQIDCDQLVVNAATSITLNTPSISAPTASILTKLLTATVDVIAGGKSAKTHAHGGISRGGAVSDPPT